LPDALAFCLLLADVDPPRFDRAIARWTARFVLEAPGITADEAALALSAAKGLAGLKNRDVAAQTLRRVAESYGPHSCFAGTSAMTANDAQGVGPSSIRRTVPPQTPCAVPGEGHPLGS